MLASLFAVWETIPSVFADCYSLLRRLPTAERVSSAPYRTAVLFMAVAAVPFAFLGRPLLIIVAFTVLGSLFIPFLAATLLYLDNAIPWPAPIRRNRALTNGVLVIILLLFLIVGALEIAALRG